jgi:molybdopterin biosynthesis enzyme
VLAEGHATPLTFHESHAQKVLAEANALIRQPPNSGALSVGERVDVLRL